MIIRSAFFVSLILTIGASLFGAQAGVELHPATLTAPPGLTALAGQPAGPPSASKAIQTILEDDFENAFPGQWQLASDTSTHWGQTTLRASGGSKSAYCAGGGDTPAPAGGPYFNNLVTWMAYGPFSLADATEATVQFDLWMKTQPAAGSLFFDYFFYGISVDGVNYSGFQTAGNTGGWVTTEFDFSEITSLPSLVNLRFGWRSFSFRMRRSPTKAYTRQLLLDKDDDRPAVHAHLLCQRARFGNGRTARLLCRNCDGQQLRRHSHLQLEFR